MRRLLLAAVIGLCAVFMLVPMGGWAAPPTGPQLLPEAACNEGTRNARPNVPRGSRDFVPHYHDFDQDGVKACYHANPTYPPGPGALE